MGGHPCHPCLPNTWGGQPNLRGRNGFLGDKKGETGWTLQWFVIKYQKIQGNCLKEATKKNNVAENVKVAYSAMENIAKSNQKG